MTLDIVKMRYERLAANYFKNKVRLNLLSTGGLLCWIYGHKICSSVYKKFKTVKTCWTRKSKRSNIGNVLQMVP